MISASTFTAPYTDFANVESRIRLVVEGIEGAAKGRQLPAELAREVEYARGTLEQLAEIKTPRARAKAFRDEHGIETMKDLWFACADHAGFLGL